MFHYWVEQSGRDHTSCSQGYLQSQDWAVSCRRKSYFGSSYTLSPFFRYRIYNLPESKLGKNALSLAHDIMAGIKPVIPDGHIPRNKEQAANTGERGNWDSYPYLKKIKVCPFLVHYQIVCCSLNGLTQCSSIVR